MLLKLITTCASVPQVKNPVETQCKKPSGLVGRYVLWSMNRRHSALTDWGLRHLSVEPRDTILDVGCGGGATIRKLAAMASGGEVYGIDYSDASVAAAKRTNAQGIASGLVDIQHGCVSHLPFGENTFNVVTAVETHFWWSDLPADIREVFRVIKPGGTFVIVAEIYKGATTKVARRCERYAPVVGMAMLTPDEHRELLVRTGYEDVQVIEEREKGWICAVGRKPLAI